MIGRAVTYAAIYDAFNAGRCSVMREEWMRLARDGDPKLRRMYVALARNAHRAYLNFLRSAVRRNTG